MSEFCQGCGKDMWEYSDDEHEKGWCISCAPELYEFGGPFGPSVDPLSGVEANR